MPSIRPLLGAIALSSAFLASPLYAQTLNIGITGEPASLDISQVSGGVWESDVLKDIYEGLLTQDPEGHRIPGVAKSWEVSDDGRTYTFHLRDDAKWSDGKPVTAEDFVFGWQHMLDPASASKYAYMLYPVKNAEAVNTGKMSADQLGVESLDDGKTFRVTLTEAAPYFLGILTHYTAFPVPKHVYDQYGKQWTQMDHIQTNGPYKPTNWVSHDHITAEKNPEFHDAANVAIDTINYYPTEDRNAGVSRFRAGELDVMRAYDSDRYQWLKENLPEATHMSPYLGSYYYVLNHRDGHPTTDIRVREALNLAVRREVMSKQIMDNTFLPAYALVPPGINHYETQHMTLDGDDMNTRLAEAKKLMKEAGYGPDKPLNLRLRYNSSDEHKKIAVALAAMWKPLGVNVQMINSEATVHYQSIANGDFDVARAGWVADYDDAENFLTLLHTGVGNNYGAYSNPEYDKLLDQANVTLDEDKRASLMQQAEQIALGDYALVPLLTYVTRNLVNPELKGWKDNVQDDHPSRWVSFKK